MGTRFELVLQGADRVGLIAAGEAAIEAIQLTHGALTRFESSSLLAHLRRVAPRWVTLDEPTFAFFQTVDALVTASRGAFDPTKSGRWSAVSFDRAGRRVALSTPVDLDFGAIAKGYAIDLAVHVLRHAGVESAFVHGGTSSGYGLGNPSGWPAWGVRLGTDGPAIQLRNRGFGLSGTWQPASDGMRPHVVDPRSGASITAARRFAVVSPSACLADGWSTAGLVLRGRPAALPTDCRCWIAEPGMGWREQ